MNENPYAAPQTSVADPVAIGAGTILDAPRALPADHGTTWIAKSFELFKRAPGLWILLMIIFMVISFAVQFVPILGPLLGSIVYPIYGGFAALMLESQRLTGRANEQTSLDLLFQRLPGLALLGLVTFAATMLIMIAVFVPVLGFSFLKAMFGGEVDPNMATDIALRLMLAVLITMALIVPLSMASWFASTLIALHSMPIVEAVRKSFEACLRNIVPFLLFGIVMLLLAIVATIPMMLGWLVLGPMFLISIYVAYRDIFFES